MTLRDGDTYAVPAEAVAAFERDGYVHLKGQGAGTAVQQRHCIQAAPHVQQILLSRTPLMQNGSRTRCGRGLKNL